MLKETPQLRKHPVLICDISKYVVVYLTSSCVNWGFLARVGQFKMRVKRAF
jgi:hypothetical protein